MYEMYIIVSVEQKQSKDMNEDAAMQLQVRKQEKMHCRLVL